MGSSSRYGRNWDDLTFMIQEGQPTDWRRVINTSLPSPEDFPSPGEE